MRCPFHNARSSTVRSRGRGLMKHRGYLLILLGFGLGVFLMVTMVTNRALAHKAKHTPEQLQAFQEVFMEQVRLGDLLFHGDAATQKKPGVKLSGTGMACARVHP